MFNLIKMNFYRLFRQKSFYVMIATAALIGWFMVFIVWLTPRLEEKLAAGGGETVEGGKGFHVGVVVGETEGAATVEPSPKLEEFNVTEFMDEFFSSGFAMILISVGTAIIANAEQKRGFIKNLGGQMKPRGMLPLSKLPAILVETAAMYAAVILSYALFGRLYYEQYTFGNLPAMCKAASLQLLLGLAFSTLILLVSTAARNAAAGIITGIILASGLLSYVYVLINRMATAYLGAPADFDISKGSLSFYINGITSEAAGREVTAALAVGAVYLILASCGGWLVMEKRDVA